MVPSQPFMANLGKSTAEDYVKDFVEILGTSARFDLNRVYGAFAGDLTCAQRLSGDTIRPADTAIGSVRLEKSYTIFQPLQWKRM